MTEKEKIQHIIADWKSLSDETEKNAFLEKLKTTVDAKDSDALLRGVQAIGELAHDLHREASSSGSAEEAAIQVFPTDMAERLLLEKLLSKMNIRYRVGV